MKSCDTYTSFMKLVNLYHMRSSILRRKPSGMTLIEVLFAMAILAILATIASTAYVDYINKARMYTAIDAITTLSTELSSYGLDTGVYPQSLAEIGSGGLLDPWKNPYQYLNIKNGGPGVIGVARKDKFLVPINSDFDLYSMGPNGQSTLPLNAAESRDDIVRANDGQYIGVAEGF